MNTRPLTIQIPETEDGRCHEDCQLNDDIKVCDLSIVGIDGPNRYETIPGPGCPWYAAEKQNPAGGP